MNDIEKLIADSEWDRLEGAPDGWQVRRVGQVVEFRNINAADWLGRRVFKMAHTPTDDEREVGRLAIERILKACMLTFATSYEDAASMAIDAVIAAGFHRSEVPEPSAERPEIPGRIWLRHADGTPKTNDELRAEAAALNAGSEPQGEPSSEVPEPSDLSICECYRDGSEMVTCSRRTKPQGEPSDAQVSVEEFRRRIAAERLRQAERGYDSDHDQHHGVDHLLSWAQDYARRGKMIASAALVEAARDLLARREPSKAEVDAAIAAYKESARTHPGRTHMHAALRAAGGVR